MWFECRTTIEWYICRLLDGILCCYYLHDMDTPDDYLHLVACLQKHKIIHFFCFYGN